MKASELAAAIIKADDGELTLDYQAFDGLRYYEADNLASRTQAAEALLADAIAWFRERGTDVARDDQLYLVQDASTECNGGARRPPEAW